MDKHDKNGRHLLACTTSITIESDGLPSCPALLTEDGIVVEGAFDAHVDLLDLEVHIELVDVQVVLRSLAGGAGCAVQHGVDATQRGVEGALARGGDDDQHARARVVRVDP